MISRSIVSALLLFGIAGISAAEDHFLHSFDRQRLTDVYFSEGANAGDIDGDGDSDVVYGPYWYEGPKFETAHEIYPPKPQPTEGYADNFFNWVHDFNGDGAAEVFVVGFPGTPAYVYENPKSSGVKGHWKKHQVIEEVSNESPQFLDIVGDARPELICTKGGAFGFATIDWSRPFETWKFHKVSDEKAPERFGHGLGIGDVNGDGKLDILMAAGWFEQPKEMPTETTWKFHSVPFTDSYGGAEMHAYDVDGDGDNDIITSLAAHDFGLAWYEQDRSGPEPVFRKHLIMGAKPGQNRYGVVFSEPHSVALVDMDGDGLKDIVTGKTYYSHHKKSPMWDAGAVVYWFRLTRTDKGVDYVPYKADGEAGIGRQVSIADVNRDGLPDIVVGGMKGAHVLIHRKSKVRQSDFEDAQPKPIKDFSTATARGPEAKIEPGTGKVAGALEAESLKVSKTSAGKTLVQEMKPFKSGKWSGGHQLFWTGAKPGDRLELEFTNQEAGDFEILGTFTMAADYAVIRCEIDGKIASGPIDLYEYPNVVSSGELKLAATKLSAGPHTLAIVVEGANPSAVKAHMVGLDYIRLRKLGDSSTD
ncbi:VCBS repeat-containing protein [bacterium]|nr:VCBS repeat-containing protein [bacterium]